MHFIISCLNVYFKITPIYIPEAPCYRTRHDPGFAYSLPTGEILLEIEPVLIFLVLLEKRNRGGVGSPVPIHNLEIRKFLRHI